MCRAYKWKGQLQDTSTHTSSPLFLGQDCQRRRKEGWFQVQLGAGKAEFISCSWQGLQHLLDIQSFPWLSRKADCPQSLLSPALAPSFHSLACPHKGQNKHQWSINPTQACNVGMFQKDSLHLCLASKEVDRGCHGCCIQPADWPHQIHVHVHVVRTWVLHPNIHQA